MFDNLTTAGLAQLVERWSHNPKVVSSILTPGTFAWMNSEGSGLGLQIHGTDVPVVRFHLLRVVNFFLAPLFLLKKVLPGFEPGLQGSEPWVLTNYTIEPY